MSRTLNNAPDVSEAVRRRVLREAERAGYALPAKRTRVDTIGVAFLNETSGLRYGGYDAVIWSGVARAARAQKTDVLLVDLHDRAPGESYAGFLKRKGVGGLVLRVDRQTRGVCAELADDGVPFVVCAEPFDDPRISYVCSESGDQSRAAVEHLIHLGHRRIGIAYHSVLDHDHEARLEGYRRAVTAAGLGVDQALEEQIVADTDGGAAAISRFLSLPDPPTAVFFTDPLATVGALRRTLELSVRVPEELSIVGVDDEQCRRLTFPMYTAVVQQAPEIGYQAGRWLCRTLAGQVAGHDLDPIRLELRSYFEVNQSTASAPSSPARVAPDGQRISCAGAYRSHGPERPASQNHAAPDDRGRRRSP